MTTTPVQSEAVALSHIGYAEAQVVARFIDERLRAAVDERTPKVPHGIAFQGQLLRTIGWLRSLAKLDDPGGDFQAITSAARSVFESAVDVTLMHFDGYANGPEKIDAWEDSAKLKHTQNVAEFLSASGRAPIDAERTMMAYATREKDRIQKLRFRWWPNENGRHPRNRWTGRDLGTDAQEADKLLPEGFDSTEQFREEVAKALDILENESRAHHGPRGGFLGVARVLRQKPFARPAPGEPRRALNPRIAARDKWKRIEALGRLVEFLRSYRAAWKARCSGEANALFPAGTYQLRVMHGAPCIGFG